MDALDNLSKNEKMMYKYLEAIQKIIDKDVKVIDIDADVHESETIEYLLTYASHTENINLIITPVNITDIDANINMDIKDVRKILELLALEIINFNINNKEDFLDNIYSMLADKQFYIDIVLFRQLANRLLNKLIDTIHLTKYDYLYLGFDKLGVLYFIKIQ